MPSLEERFWSKVDRGADDACWLWTAGLTHYGYGQFTRPTEKGWRPTPASRVAYELTHGPLPEGMWVLHSCDVPACCNPAHLRIGTPKDNSRDMVKRGRASKPWARLTPDDVREIRRRAATETQASLADEYQIARSAISKIVSRTRWKDVV